MRSAFICNRLYGGSVVRAIDASAGVRVGGGDEDDDEELMVDDLGCRS